MSKHLKDYPLITEAFRLIMADQPYPTSMGVRLMTEAKVPVGWERSFRFAEATLAQVKGKTVGECGGLRKEIETELSYGGVRLDEDAFENVVLPVNDGRVFIMRACGVNAIGIESVEAVLGEFFDGALRDVFQTGHKRN